LVYVIWVTIATLIPIYCFFILKLKFSIETLVQLQLHTALSAAVTFVTAVTFLEMQNYTFSGHMVAVMALMEAPAIIIGVSG
jgi:hypothetical protein